MNNSDFDTPCDRTDFFSVLLWKNKRDGMIIMARTIWLDKATLIKMSEAVRRSRKAERNRKLKNGLSHLSKEENFLVVAFTKE